MQTAMDGKEAILVADEASAPFAMRCMLERCGFTVVAEVATAREALHVAESFRPRVIVVDLALTGVFGLKLVPALHARAPGAAVFLVSPFPRLRLPSRYAGAADLVDFEDPRILERQLHRLNPVPSLSCRCGGH